MGFEQWQKESSGFDAWQRGNVAVAEPEIDWTKEPTIPVDPTGQRYVLQQQAGAEPGSIGQPAIPQVPMESAIEQAGGLAVKTQQKAAGYLPNAKELGVVGKTFLDTIRWDTPSDAGFKDLSQFPEGREYYNNEVGEILDRARWVRTYVISLGGRLGPKSLKGELKEHAAKFSGLGPVVVPATTETAQLALEWGWLYPQMFKAAGMTTESIKRIPQVAKAMKSLEASGGLSKIAAKFPRVYATVKGAGGAFIKGEMVGQSLGLAESVGKDMKPADILWHMNKQGAQFGTIAAVFSAVGSADQAIAIKRLRNQMLTRGLQQIRQMSQGVIGTPGGKAKMKSLKTFEDAMVKYVDDVVAAYEAELTGAVKNELYKNIRGKAPRAQQAINDFLKSGYRPELESFAGKSPLKTGMGERPPVDVMRGEPTTRAGEVIREVKEFGKAAKHPVKAVQEVLKKAEVSRPRPSAESVMPKEGKTVLPVPPTQPSAAKPPIKAEEQGVKGAKAQEGARDALFRVGEAQVGVIEAIKKHGFGGITKAEKHPVLVEAEKQKQLAENDLFNSLNPKFKIGDSFDAKGQAWIVENANFDLAQSADTMRKTGFPSTFTFHSISARTVDGKERYTFFHNELDWLKTIDTSVALKDVITQPPTEDKPAKGLMTTQQMFDRAATIRANRAARQAERDKVRDDLFAKHKATGDRIRKEAQERRTKAQRQHKGAVEQLFKKGKPVAQDLRDMYPDLVEKYEGKAAKEAWQDVKTKLVTEKPLGVYDESPLGGQDVLVEPIEKAPIIKEVRKNEGEEAAQIVKDLLDKEIHTIDTHVKPGEILVQIESSRSVPESVENLKILSDAGLLWEPQEGMTYVRVPRTQPPTEAKPAPTKAAKEASKGGHRNITVRKVPSYNVIKNIRVQNVDKLTDTQLVNLFAKYRVAKSAAQRGRLSDDYYLSAAGPASSGVAPKNAWVTGELETKDDFISEQYKAEIEKRGLADKYTIWDETLTLTPTAAKAGKGKAVTSKAIALAAETGKKTLYEKETPREVQEFLRRKHNLAPLTVTKDTKDAANVMDAYFAEGDDQTAQAKVEGIRLQKQVKQVMKSKKFGPTQIQADMAIQVYIDLKNNPDQMKYYDKLTKQQKAVVDLAQNLPVELKAVADDIIKLNNKIGLNALDKGIIGNVIENYSMRLWEGTKQKDRPLFRKFGTKTARAKHRTLEGILHGWSLGKKLRVRGATNAHVLMRTQVATTIVDRQLLKTAKEWGLIGNQQHDDWVKIEHPNFTDWKWAGKVEDAKTYGKNFFVTEDGNLMERVPMYAEPKLGKHLNNALGTSSLYGIPGVKTLTEYNAILKRWILFTSFFHHQAYIRSYMLGGKTGLRNLSPTQAYKAGKQAIENYTPDFQRGIRNGLTVGLMQDFDEVSRSKISVFGRMLNKVPVAGHLAKGINWLRKKNEDWLFGKIGPYLKVQAYLLEYAAGVKKHRKALEKGIITLDDIAATAAKLANDDFGGLHLRRMGRNPTLQHIFRLLALAPDWTESNVRSAVKAFKLGEEGRVYRAFWARIAAKGLLAIVFFNYLMSLFDDERDFVERYKMAWKNGKMRWMDIDITPLYRATGGKADKQKYFSLFGHFKDPIKFVAREKFKEPSLKDVPDPVRSLLKSAKYKGSVITRIFADGITGKDWKGSEFTTILELLGSDDKGVYVTSRKGKYEKGDPKGGKLKGELTKWSMGGVKPLGLEQVPSFLIYEAKAATPIQVQNGIHYLLGQMDGFDAVLKGLGAHMSSTYDPAEKYQGLSKAELVETLKGYTYKEDWQGHHYIVDPTTWRPHKGEERMVERLNKMIKEQR